MEMSNDKTSIAAQLDTQQKRRYLPRPMETTVYKL